MIEALGREQPVLIPPVVLDDYDEFCRFARDAALVTYRVEHFNGPFTDHMGRVRRVVFCAVGAMVNGVPMTFKYVFEPSYDASADWDAVVCAVDRAVRTAIADLGAQTDMVRGTVESGVPLGAVLSARI